MLACQKPNAFSLISQGFQIRDDRVLVTLLIGRLRLPGPDIRWDLGRLSYQACVTPRWALGCLDAHLSEAPIVIVGLVQEDSAFLLQSRR